MIHYFIRNTLEIKIKDLEIDQVKTMSLGLINLLISVPCPTDSETFSFHLFCPFLT